MKQIKACGAAVSVISGALDVDSYALPTGPTGDNVAHRLLAFPQRLVVAHRPYLNLVDKGGGRRSENTRSGTGFRKMME
jgi:hypothetical protein